MKSKHIVWIGGVDEYYTNYTDAKRDYDYWIDNGYDDVVIEKVEKMNKEENGIWSEFAEEGLEEEK
jgi:hypothetical protein